MPREDAPAAARSAAMTLRRLALACTIGVALGGCSFQPTAHDEAIMDAAHFVPSYLSTLEYALESASDADAAKDVMNSGETYLGATLDNASAIAARNTTHGVFAYRVIAKPDDPNMLTIDALIRGKAVTSDWTGEESAYVYVCATITQPLPPGKPATLAETECPAYIVDGTSSGPDTERISLGDLRL